MRVHIAPLRPTTALDRKSQSCNDSAQPTCSHASGDPRLHRLCLLVLFTQASGGTHGMEVQGEYCGLTPLVLVFAFAREDLARDYLSSFRPLWNHFVVDMQGVNRSAHFICMRDAQTPCGSQSIVSFHHHQHLYWKESCLSAEGRRTVTKSAERDRFSKWISHLNCWFSYYA